MDQLYGIILVSSFVDFTELSSQISYHLCTVHFCLSRRCPWCNTLLFIRFTEFRWETYLIAVHRMMHTIKPCRYDIGFLFSTSEITYQRFLKFKTLSFNNEVTKTQELLTCLEMTISSRLLAKLRHCIQLAHASAPDIL